MKFEVSGIMNQKGSKRLFLKTIEDVPNENVARERAISLLGSTNGINRRNIKVDKVKKIE